MSVMDDLIYDRNSADIDRVLYLREKGWQNMTSAERTEYLMSMKGAYNVSDANRVGTAVLFLESYLNGLQTVLDAYRESYGVAGDAIFNVTWGSLSLTVKTDWATTDIPSVAQMTVYLQNVDDVISCISITRHLPSGMDNLTITGANEIEKALQAEYAAGLDFEAAKKALIERTAQSWFYCGEIYCGEV